MIFIFNKSSVGGRYIYYNIQKSQIRSTSKGNGVYPNLFAGYKDQP